MEFELQFSCSGAISSEPLVVIKVSKKKLLQNKFYLNSLKTSLNIIKINII